MGQGVVPEPAKAGADQNDAAVPEKERGPDRLSKLKSVDSQSGEENNISERVPQEELRGGNEVHSREQEARDRLEQRVREAETQLKRPLTQHERQDVENQAAYDYANENGLWVDDLYSLGEPTNAGGNENTLALDRENGVIYKANNLFNSEQSISKFFDGIENHNKLFPENKYELVGFTGHNIDGRPYVEPIVKQDYVPGAKQATQKEIDAHMKSLGWEEVLQD